MSGKRYPEEFKTEAVKQVIDRGYSVASVATRLDITTHSLYALDKEVRSGLLHFFIKPIRPPLHHFSALIEILSVVVNSANPVC